MAEKLFSNTFNGLISSILFKIILKSIRTLDLGILI